MIDLATLPRLVAERPAGIAARLGDLRREFEQGEDWPHMEVNAALFLSDVCRALGLSEPERLRVLGPEAGILVKSEEGTHLVLYFEE
jgi:hypothetical protein